MSDGVKTTGRGNSPPPPQDAVAVENAKNRFIEEEAVDVPSNVPTDKVVKDDPREAGRRIASSASQVFRVPSQFNRQSDVSEGDLRRMDVFLKLWGLISESKFDPNSGSSGSESGE